MTAPPDVPAEDLWLKLLQRPRPSEVVDFPRKGADGKPLGRMRIQVLTLEQHDVARIRAREYLARQYEIDSKEIGTDDALKEVLGDATAAELLAMACQHENLTPGASDENPAYPLAFAHGGAEQVRTSLTADEVASLFTAYLLIQQKYGPSERSIGSDEELNAWIDKLVEGASALPLAQLDSYQRVELTTSLAARCYFLSSILASQWESLPESTRSVLQTLGIGPGSATKPPAESTENGSSPSESPLKAPYESRVGAEPLTMEQALELSQELFPKG